MRYLFRLEELQVGDNELKSLDFVLQLPRLRILVAAHNMITTFEVSFWSLQLIYTSN